MTQKHLYAAWCVLTILSVIIVFSTRVHRKSKSAFQLNEVIDVAVAVFGGVSGFYLIYQTWKLYDVLQRLVNNEGLVAMTLGGLASVWFGCGKVLDLASKD